MHRNFFKCVLGIQKSTADEIVLAELGRIPLQTHFWQCIHNTDSTRLVTLAMLEGFFFSEQGVAFNDVCPLWRQHVALFLQPHTTSVVMKLDTVWQVTAAVVESAKQQYVEQYSFNSAIVTL